MLNIETVRDEIIYRCKRIATAHGRAHITGSGYPAYSYPAGGSDPSLIIFWVPKGDNSLLRVTYAKSKVRELVVYAKGGTAIWNDFAVSYEEVRDRLREIMVLDDLAEI